MKISPQQQNTEYLEAIIRHQRRIFEDLNALETKQFRKMRHLSNIIMLVGALVSFCMVGTVALLRHDGSYDLFLTVVSCVGILISIAYSLFERRKLDE